MSREGLNQTALINSHKKWPSLGPCKAHRYMSDLKKVGKAEEKVIEYEYVCSGSNHLMGQASQKHLSQAPMLSQSSQPYLLPGHYCLSLWLRHIWSDEESFYRCASKMSSSFQNLSTSTDCGLHHIISISCVTVVTPSSGLSKNSVFLVFNFHCTILRIQQIPLNRSPFYSTCNRIRCNLCSFSSSHHPGNQTVWPGEAAIPCTSYQ